jgi:hypothetical protein
MADEPPSDDSATPKGQVSPTVTPAGRDGLSISPQDTFHIEGIAGKALDQRIAAALNKVLGYIITAVVAGLIAFIVGVSYELNGKISEAVGRQSVQEELYQVRTGYLQERIEDGKRQLRYYQCLNDPKVKDKAGCYR